MKKNLELTKSLFMRRFGLKIDGKTVLNKKYHSLYDDFVNTNTPIIVIEFRKGEFGIYDVNRNEILKPDNKMLEIKTSFENKTVFDGSEDIETKEIAYYYPTSILYKRDGATNLYLNGEMYSTAENFKRLEPIRNSYENINFIGIKKDGTYEFINYSKHTTLSIDDISRSNNPYTYLQLPGKRHQHSIRIGFSYDGIIEKVNEYYDNLKLKGQNQLVEEDYKNERTSLIRDIYGHFKDENQNAQLQNIEEKQRVEEFQRLIDDKIKLNDSRSKEFYELQKRLSNAKNNINYTQSFSEVLNEFEQRLEKNKETNQTLKNEQVKKHEQDVEMIKK